jgi:hypothetical protein
MKATWKEKGKYVNGIDTIFINCNIDLYEDNTQLDLNSYATKGYNYSTEAGIV